MKREKRLKTKMLQFRVTPEDFKVFESKALDSNKTKTELFKMFLEMIKEKKI